MANSKSQRHYRCHNHADRFPAVVGKCWECLLGKAGFKKKFGELADGFYQEGGPGYAGYTQFEITRKVKTDGEK